MDERIGGLDGWRIIDYLFNDKSMIKISDFNNY